MPKNEDIFFTKEGNLTGVAVVTGVPVTVFTADATNGSKLFMINVATIAGATTAVDLVIDTGGGNEVLGRFTGAVAEKDNLLEKVLSLPSDKNGNVFMNLPPGAIVKVDTTGNDISVGVYAEDY